MKASKVTFLVFLCLLSLCAVSPQPVKSQTSEVIYIESDGSIFTSTNATVPIQRVGDVYTFTGDIIDYSLVVLRDNIIVDGAGYVLQGEIGIDISYRRNVTIKNMQIAGSQSYGVYLGNAFGNTITDNTILYNFGGIMVQNGSDNNVISSNNLTNNGFGISIESSSNNVLTNNYMNNTINLGVFGTEYSHFVNDIDVSNTIEGKKIYYLLNQRDLTISPSTYPDLGYLALINCVNIVVRNLEQTNNGQGLLLVSTVDSTITQNNIANNNQGIMLFLSSNNIISGNNIEGNNRGVQLSRSSTNNSISTNVVTNNIGGVYFFDSSQNIVEANNITDNEIGIGLKSSTNNIIYKNYFINNNKQVDDFYEAFSVAPSINVWNLNYPLGGNYWSDYTGSDVKGGSDQDQFGGDNIGDSPYVIYENNIDNYPLVPFTTPSAILIVSPENKTYNENSVLLTFTEIEQTSWVGYSLDELANVTITKSITLAGLSEGLHRLTVYARNVDGIESSVTIYFTIAQGAEPPQSERFPITGIIIVIVIAAVGASLLVYFMIIRKKR